MRSVKSIAMLAAMQRMELYYMAHPGSPSAVRRPRLSMRGKMWTALLGSNLRDGIVGLGKTVEAALNDFDAKYLRALRPPDVPSV
ncbi:MAG: hypothetical protein ACREFF_01360 [Candidatus Udaeobacter sp.]